MITSLITGIFSGNTIAKTTAEDLKQVQYIKVEMESFLNSFDKKYKDKTYTRDDIALLGKSSNEKLDGLKVVVNEFESESDEE